MFNHRVLLLIILVFFASCVTQNKSHKHKMDVEFNDFSFKKLEQWKLIELRGIDSQMGYLITENNDTIIYEYGRNIQRIEGTLIKVLSLSEKNKNFNDENSIFRYSKSASLDQDLGVFLSEYFLIDTIGKDIVSRIQIPKIPGKGLTGFYSECIDEECNRLNFIGIDLKKEEQIQLLELFKTIKIKNDSSQ